MKKSKPLMEARAQLIGWDSSLLNSLRQPKIASGNATETNQQNDGAERRAGPGDGNRDHKRDGEERGQTDVFRDVVERDRHCDSPSPGWGPEAPPGTSPGPPESFGIRLSITPIKNIPPKKEAALIQCPADSPYAATNASTPLKNISTNET
jgi:hypothetical protein